jgi:chromosome segregation protein
MEDVIFNGSSVRKPSSLAEVRITLENDGVFPAAYLNFTEMTVTRRLYRDGESEYLINKIPVRLKDVKEVFMDSGARTYAVIEQGEIERVILAKPEDRRAIIEEAAGITKYKSRKEESQRKLDTTEQNLLRLNDIISELEKQLGQVERQAKKAETYRKLTEELKGIEINVGLHDYAHLNNETNTLRASVSEEENAKTDLDNELARIELDIEGQKAQKLGIEEELNNLQNSTVDVNTAINTAKARLEMIDNEKANLNRNNDIRGNEVESLKIRIEREEHELGNIDNEFTSQEETLRNANTEAEKAQAQLDSKAGEYGELETHVEDKKSSLLEHVQKELTSQNNITNFEERLESNLLKLERHEKDRSRYETELNSTKETLGLLEGNFNDKQTRRKEIEDELNGLKSRQDELKNTLSSKEREREDAKLRLNSIHSRLDVLFDLSRQLEGVSSGVKHILNSGRWGDRTRGILADVIETAPEFEKAVSSVIGKNLDAIVVDEGWATVDIIRALKDEHQGQATFLPSNLRTSNKGDRASEIFGGNANRTTYLLDHVNCDGGYTDLVETLFSSIYVVEDINTALDLWNNSKTTDYTLVTMEGDIVDGTGVVKGGSAEAITSSLLERKREIKELEEQKNQLTQTVSGLEEDHSRTSGELNDIYGKLESCNSGLSGLAAELASLSKELELTKENVKRQEQRLSETTFDLDQVRFENNHLSKEIDNSRNILAMSGEAKRLLENELREDKSRMDAISGELENLRRSVTELRVTASTISERFRSVEERKQFLQEALNGDRERLNNLHGEGERAQNRERELTEEYEGTKNQIHSDIENVDNINRQINDVRDRYNALSEGIGSFEKTIKDIRHQLNERSENIVSINARLADFSVNIGVLKQRLIDKYEMDITTMSLDSVTDEGFNKEELRGRITELNSKLTDIGPVNLLAIDEFDTLNERCTFLSTQRDDLLKSMEDLRNAIKKIDDTSKVRFKATFEMVNEKFKKFFPILFGGGSAELTMTNPEDLLETGVDIFAQLPGKRTQNINLFSGGEKSLTAISLVFSIFAIKPSPFCILDEVDAPLDDANITRFNEAVRALVDKSQFIIITHNKKTMEMLDVLYGVTMEDPGISRLVSVRLGELQATTTATKAGKKGVAYMDTTTDNYVELEQ